jgi:hypothetical protein
MHGEYVDGWISQTREGPCKDFGWQLPQLRSVTSSTLCIKSVISKTKQILKYLKENYWWVFTKKAFLARTVLKSLSFFFLEAGSHYCCLGWQLLWDYTCIPFTLHLTCLLLILIIWTQGLKFARQALLPLEPRDLKYFKKKQNRHADSQL